MALGFDVFAHDAIGAVGGTQQLEAQVLVYLLGAEHHRMPLGNQWIIPGGIGNRLLGLQASLTIDDPLQQVQPLLLMVDLQRQQLAPLLSQFPQPTVGTELTLIEGHFLLGQRTLQTPLDQLRILASG